MFKNKCILYATTFIFALSLNIQGKRLKKSHTTHAKQKQISLKSDQPTVAYSQKNTVIVTDLHDVLLKFEFEKFWKSFKKHPKKLKSLGKLIKYKFGNQRQSIEYEILKNQKSSDNSQATLDLINAHSLKKDTFKVLQNLHAHGFMIFAFSNLGKQSYDDISKHYPELNTLFTGMYLPSKDNNYMTKWSSKTFKTFAQDTIVPQFMQKNDQVPELIILIDDSAAKLKKAKQGFHALQKMQQNLQSTKLITIQYKNHQQLQKELQKLVIITA